MKEKVGPAQTAVKGFPLGYLLPTGKSRGKEKPCQQQEDSQDTICDSFEFIHSINILSNVLGAGVGAGNSKENRSWLFWSFLHSSRYHESKINKE